MEKCREVLAIARDELWDHRVNSDYCRLITNTLQLIISFLIRNEGKQIWWREERYRGILCDRLHQINVYALPYSMVILILYLKTELAKIHWWTTSCPMVLAWMKRKTISMITLMRVVTRVIIKTTKRRRKRRRRRTDTTRIRTRTSLCQRRRVRGSMVLLKSSQSS